MTPEPPTAIAFGPLPSRRLGRSLGINNILDITSVHPMREEAVADLLARSRQGRPVVEGSRRTDGSPGASTGGRRSS